MFQAFKTKFSVNKVCNVEDFSDLAPLIREIFPHDITEFGNSFPIGHEYRKHWEVAMAVKALRENGSIKPDSEILGVGAGTEPTIFFLTNYVRRVFATDLYLSPGWEDSSGVPMMLSPEQYWPSPWQPRRLVVQHMNALNLLYEDNTFDGIFSSSSLEHFGTWADVRVAIAEMFRVLKPGGLLSLSTEFRISGPSPGMPGVLMFDEEEISEHIIGDLGWKLTTSFDASVSHKTKAAAQDFAGALEDVRKHVRQHGSVIFHKLKFSRYPAIVLHEGDLIWTSCHLAIRKDPRSL